MTSELTVAKARRLGIRLPGMPPRMPPIEPPAPKPRAVKPPKPPKVAPAPKPRVRFGRGAEPPEATFRPPTVCRLSGVSYRRLDYWDRTGLVHPSVCQATGSGTQRLYSFDDVVRLTLIKRMLDGGLALTHIRRALAKVITPGTWIVIDGRGGVFQLASPGVLVDLLASGTSVFAISVAAIRRELEATVAKKKRKTA